MKKLAITSVAVLIALIGFTTVLCLLPGGNCCSGEREGECEMWKGKCPHEKGEYRMGEGKCEDRPEGCEMHKGKCEGEKNECEGEKGECGHERTMVKEWKDADGKMHKEVKVIVGGDEEMGGSCQMHSGGGSCNMGMGNMGHGCCCCCMMMNMKGCRMDSMKMDTTRVKVRGKI